MPDAVVTWRLARSEACPFWMFSQRTSSEHGRAEFQSLWLGQNLGEEIGNHPLGGQVLQLDALLIDAITDVVILDQDVAHACRGAVGDTERRLIVHEESCWWKPRIGDELLLQLTQEHDLLRSCSHGHVLCVSRSSGVGGLQLGLP